MVPESATDRVLAVMRTHDNAAVIARVEGAESGGEVRLEAIGGNRVLDKLSGDQLPRIC